MQFLAIFLHLCVVIKIPNIHVKDHFDWPRSLSLRVMWICPSFRLNSWRPQRKNSKSTFFGFPKSKSLRQVFENSSPKGFSRQNMKKSIISILDIYSPLVLQNQYSKSSFFSFICLTELFQTYILIIPDNIHMHNTSLRRFHRPVF